MNNSINKITPSINYIGKFDESDLKSGADKKAIEESMGVTGMKYIKSKTVKVGGKMFIKIWLTNNYDLV